MSVNRIQCMSTTAEVAKTISTLPDWQLPAGERGNRRRICLMPNRRILGLHRICAELSSNVCDVVLPGPNVVFVPCASVHGDFYLREEAHYEEDTFYHAGKGFGDP